MMNIISNMNVKNNQLIGKPELNTLLANDTAKIYEVIRVIKKNPIFLKEHFERMRDSIRLSDVEGNLNFDEFQNSINLLIKENNFENCNIRVSYYYDSEPVVLFYFIESSYPAKEQFMTGVHTVTAKIHRDNPNIKAFQKNFKEKVEEIIKNTKAYEVILINDDDTVSEGSKSNIFFIKNNKLVTSPDDNVLLGVTRSKVIEVCERNGIEVIRRVIRYDELDNFDAAFITGTSNDVLPIKAIDDRIYNSADNDTVKKALELYLNEMEKEIK
ncbi:MULTISPECIES: aminotransferase class IV [Sedimentibacter]|uniref:Aminotransferase class IV n=1 Tax=Sedimentibacter hydroxybenzoicus DSM 7310 TaxID=1123245 RepID=A0A974BJJ0_SEDHY|nr:MULTISPECIES: aminotransferase class IV [Sedimentibacter]NYB74430.1 aminotransferase class IV [Sedimentibacter hydroxybenzoicus DSM 7310]